MRQQEYLCDLFTGSLIKLGWRQQHSALLSAVVAYKSWWEQKSCSFPTVCTKFPTEEVMGAQNWTDLTLPCGRSNKSHYTFRPSVRLSRSMGSQLENKKSQKKANLVWKIPQGMTDRCANVQRKVKRCVMVSYRLQRRRCKRTAAQYVSTGLTRYSSFEIHCRVWQTVRPSRQNPNKSELEWTEVEWYRPKSLRYVSVYTDLCC